MKILIVDQYSDLGGAQRVLLELLPVLQDQRWTCVLAVPGRGALRTRAEKLGIRCEEITCGPFGCGAKTLSDLLKFSSQFPRLRSQLKRLVASFSPDVLYVNGPRLVPAACSLGSGTPKILVHLHNYLKQPYVAGITGRFLRRARASIVANCNFVLEPFRESLRDASVEVIYNGVQGCPPARENVRSCRIGIVGRISPDKGHRVFIEAARLLQASLPQARFVVCGGTQFDDPEAELFFKHLRSLSAGLPVDFTGWQDDVCNVLPSLDLLIVPSMPFSEATTRVIPEAYSAGVPVLASDLPGIREILTDGKTGFLFPAGDAAALANRIREIIHAPPELLSVVAENSRRAFEERFTLDLCHRRMIDTLKRAAAGAL